MVEQGKKIIKKKITLEKEEFNLQKKKQQKLDSE